MDEQSHWQSLAGLISENPAVASRVKHSRTDPQGHFAEHEAELAERGMDSADQVRTIVVLIDALASVGEVAYLDWNSPVDDVIGLVGQLPRVAAAGTDLQSLIAADEEADVETVVGHVNSLLSDAGARVVIVDEGSDAHPLVAVATDAAQRLTEIASDLDVEVRAPIADQAIVDELLRKAALGPDERADRTITEAQRDRRVDADQLLDRRRSADKAIKFYERGLPDGVKSGSSRLSRVGTAMPVELAARLKAGYASGQNLHALAKQVSKAARAYAWTMETAAPMARTPVAAMTSAVDADWAMYLTFEGNSELVLATVDLLSWAVALDDRDAVHEIITAAPVVAARHPVIGHLASLSGFDADVSGELPDSGSWEAWLAVINAEADDRSTALAERVRTWPATTWRHWIVPPTDSRYAGRFCFDVAPLVACLDIEDSGARELPDYPKDLVDFARKSRS
ncbi:DUF6630 family protein [Propionibacteriaceae bacterium Y1685]